jgi:hypothetical protein
MVCRGLLNELSSFFKGYESSRVTDFDCRNFDREFKKMDPFQQGVVWDIETGAILVLGKNKKIKSAILGDKQLS